MIVLATAIVASAACVPDARAAAPAKLRPGASAAVVKRLPPAARVSVSFVFEPRGRAVGTVLRLRRSRIAISRTARGRFLLVAGRRRPLVRVRHRRAVRVQLMLDTAARRVEARARDGRLVVRRRVVWRDRLVIPRSTCCVRRLRIVAVRRQQRASLPATPAAVPAPTAARGVGIAFRLFSADSVWNRALAGDAPLDPANAAITGTLRNTVAANQAARTGPWIQTTDHSTPLYRVPANQATVRVKLDAGAWDAPLQSALDAVPIPPGARPAAGSDAHLTVWQPTTGRLWELWGARLAADGWHANYGGAMADVPNSPGYYGAGSWPRAGSHWGATATSLPAIAGTMLIDELRAGEIPHALAMAIPAARKTVFSWPAQRTDGTSADASSVPEGARFRIDPRLNIDALGLPPVTRMMAKAAQRYGIIVRDQTGHAVGFYAEDPSPTGQNPYNALFGGQYPVDLLRRFPWEHLQLLRMQLSGG